MFGLLRKAPVVTQQLNIKPRGGDDAQQTQAKMAGGWLVDLAAFPETCPQVEAWMCAAAEKAFKTLRTDPQDAERWYGIADELATVISYAGAARKARETGIVDGPPSIHELAAHRARNAQQ